MQQRILSLCLAATTTTILMSGCSVGLDIEGSSTVTSTRTSWSFLDDVRCDSPSRPVWAPYDEWEFSAGPGLEEGDAFTIQLPVNAEKGRATARSQGGAVVGSWWVGIADADEHLVYEGTGDVPLAVGDGNGGGATGSWYVGNDRNFTVAWTVDGYVERLSLAVETLGCVDSPQDVNATPVPNRA